MRKRVTSSYMGDIFLPEYDVQEAILKGEDITVIFEDEEMTLSPHKLSEGRVRPKEYPDKKREGKTYRLVAFKWIPNTYEDDKGN